MPDESTLLGLLKWVAIGLGLGSALWGLLGAKPTQELPDGRKQLTPAGVVTLALVVGAGLVSAMTFGFETQIKRADAKQAADEKIITQNRAIATAANSLAGRVAALAAGAEARATRSEARALRAEQRAAQADARALAVALDAAEQRRDLDLSRKVGLGAQENLGRTQQALGQIERVLQPIEALTVAIEWEFPGDAPAMTAWSARVAEAVRLGEAERKLHYYDRTYRLPPYEPLAIVPLAKDLLPGFGGMDERELADSFRNLGFELFVFVEGTPPEFIEEQVRRGTSPSRNVADLHLRFLPGRPEYASFVVATRSLRMVMDGTAQFAAMSRSGAIVSLPDLERGIVVLAVHDSYLLGQSRPVRVTIATPSRRYEPSVASMRHLALKGSPRAIYFLPPLQSILAANDAP